MVNTDKSNMYVSGFFTDNLPKELSHPGDTPLWTYPDAHIGPKTHGGQLIPTVLLQNLKIIVTVKPKTQVVRSPINTSGERGQVLMSSFIGSRGSLFLITVKVVRVDGQQSLRKKVPWVWEEISPKVTISTESQTFDLLPNSEK